LWNRAGSAARSIAIFEERAVYRGLEKAGIHGLEQASDHERLVFKLDPGLFDSAVSRGVEILQVSSVDGPHALVLGTKPYQFLMRGMLEGGLLLSTRGGDHRLTVGQDFSVGYTDHDRDGVEFYLVESFTFVAEEPKAPIVFVLE
jgi:uncharacterized linocin/CFP29 family protein